MKMHALRCPNCDGNIEVEDGLDIFFCKYCGYKIVLEGQSDEAYRAKTRIKDMEHDERMRDKKYAHERYKIETKNKKESHETKIIFLVVVAFILVFTLYFEGEKHSSNKQERDLQMLVEEIQVDIQNEEFDNAYIKAQSIKYTAGWSSEIEDKWDNTRKEVINRIIESEKEATGKSTHKPEKDGWFDWFN